MATHFSIVAWRIRSTEEPGGVQLIMSQTRLKRLSTAWQGVELNNKLTLSEQSSLAALRSRRSPS